jgi:hypothetical protein
VQSKSNNLGDLSIFKHIEFNLYRWACVQRDSSDQLIGDFFVFLQLFLKENEMYIYTSVVFIRPINCDFTKTFHGSENTGNWTCFYNTISRYIYTDIDTGQDFVLYLQYSQRGSRIFRESSWCEIDRGLNQVTQVKPRIGAVQVITKSAPSRYRIINLR